jgi:hypothetical protein
MINTKKTKIEKLNDKISNLENKVKISEKEN